MRVTNTVACVLAAGAGLLFASAALAQGPGYPDRPVKIIVPFAAAGPTDVVARLIAQKLSEKYGHQFYIENMTGAGGNLGMAAAAKAPADGYTILFVSSSFTVNPSLYAKPPYDAEKDFAPVTKAAGSPNGLFVHPDIPARPVKELVELTRANPGKLSYSSSGAGGVPHLVMEYLKQRFELDMVHVPYKNSPQSISDIAAGHVSLAFAEAGASVPLIKDGKLRALAVSAAERLPTIGDVAPMREVSDAKDFEAVSWHALFARSGTPAPIVTKLHDEMTRIMSKPEIQQKITNLGLIPLNPPSIPDTETYIKSETAKWGKLVKSLGLEGSQ